MTRARDLLYVLWPQRYYHRSNGLSDKHSYAQLCRFFTPDVRGTMDELAVAEPGSCPEAAGETKAKVDVAACIRDLWK